MSRAILALVGILTVALGAGVYEVHRVRHQLNESISYSRTAMAKMDEFERLLEKLTDNTVERTVSEVAKATAEVRTALVDLAAAPSVPAMENLHLTEIEGYKIKTLPYEMRRGVAVTPILIATGKSGTDTRTKDGLLMPWPDPHASPYRQDFAPYVFAQNLVMEADAARLGSSQSTAAIAYLLRQLEKYTASEGDADYVFYDFDFRVRSATFNRGWRSAFANALVALGLAEMYAATGDRSFLQRAQRYVKALTLIGGITIVNDAQYLWFEEYPEVDGKPTHVFNGHIATILALYRYMEIGGDRSLEPYLAAAVTTMHRYLPESRRPGRRSLYGLNAFAFPDYGPERIILFTRALVTLTGDESFRLLATAFATEMPMPH